MARIKCSANMNAFLDLIGFSEGVYIPGSDEGYNVVVGKTLFSDYSKHPNKKVWIQRINDYSTAAGKYQILGWIAAHYIKALKLPDFGPESQDKIAMRLIVECHAVNAIESGDIFEAIKRCNSRWASFPGNNYGQKQTDMAKLVAYYMAAGGEQYA